MQHPKLHFRLGVVADLRHSALGQHGRNARRDPGINLEQLGL